MPECPAVTMMSDIQADEFGCEFGAVALTAAREAILDFDVLPVGEADLAKPLNKTKAALRIWLGRIAA